MKTHLIIAMSLSTIAALTSCSDKAPATGDKAGASTAGAPADKEQAFVATFRKALEEKDKKTIESLMLKDGTPAEILEFFEMMLDVPDGVTVESVELVTPTAEEAAKYQSAMEMPDGKKYKLSVIPVKQLVISMKEGTSGSSQSKLPVAGKDGKLVIPMPVPAP